VLCVHHSVLVVVFVAVVLGGGQCLGGTDEHRWSDELRECVCAWTGNQTCMAVKRPCHITVLDVVHCTPHIKTSG
jgi:hypothetical protein